MAKRSRLSELERASLRAMHQETGVPPVLRALADMETRAPVAEKLRALADAVETPEEREWRLSVWND